VTQYILYKNKDFNRIAEDDPAGAKIQAFDTVKTVNAAARLSSGGVPNFIGLDRRSAIIMAEKLGIELSHSGIGVVSEQTPAPGSGKSDVVKLIYRPPSL